MTDNATKMFVKVEGARSGLLKQGIANLQLLS